ncbi:type II toxin-antitoxin system VapC family toxin [Mycobacterium shinjukuense]|uniref:Ribonuclease VapC n=1 Tax=Mycobacterium shinjukuense TaxID=398694 RepID=A0A7I7MQ23_9MYCO|nr:type II toxin-antitoxin system VapC family toxin [Mycobacterium shinjukuense]MCV6985698.1 type II toxin-antitoxin system VapC family toxin [Mycobacterium shinjukuense]ORB71586.1 VapC toxin family PIN domain ribonuclease [Mycobacterium shinjukuense]BBX74315.1 ribonuclease VapC [Mycobacterium shinjukuense]
MIFVDTNVFMYAVGRDHPLRTPAREFLEHSLEHKDRLVTSAEVAQELLHTYLPVGRISTLDSALTLARELAEIWPVEVADVVHARTLHNRHPGLGARDLLHLACCQRRGVTRIKTFDPALASAFGS